MRDASTSKCSPRSLRAWRARKLLCLGVSFLVVSCKVRFTHTADDYTASSAPQRQLMRGDVLRLVRCRSGVRVHCVFTAGSSSHPFCGSIFGLTTEKFLDSTGLSDSVMLSTLADGSRSKFGSRVFRHSTTTLRNPPSRLPRCAWRSSGCTLWHALVVISSMPLKPVHRPRIKGRVSRAGAHRWCPGSPRYPCHGDSVAAEVASLDEGRRGRRRCVAHSCGL